MGQRLNIEIHNKGELIANCYYRWSAYTEAAINLTKQVLKFINENKAEYAEPVVLAVKALESTGAGVLPADMANIMGDMVLSKYTYVPAEDRNNGLICVTQDGMENTRYWEEGRVTVYLDEERVGFDVFSHTLEEKYKEYCEDWGDDATIDPLEWDNKNVKFDDFNGFADDVYNASGGIKFRNGKWELYLKIE